MAANGYKTRKTKADSQDSQRFEASRPLELAQMDILEFFINKLKVYVILVLDDYSRFILGWSLLEKSSMDEVIHTVDRAVNRYGKMEEILTDRGFVFYSWHGINRFEKYLEMLGIDHTHASAHHPKTLGKVESCNKTIKYELLKQRHFSTAQEASQDFQKGTDAARGIYPSGDLFRYPAYDLCSHRHRSRQQPTVPAVTHEYNFQAQCTM